MKFVAKNKLSKKSNILNSNYHKLVPRSVLFEITQVSRHKSVVFTLVQQNAVCTQGKGDGAILAFCWRAISSIHSSSTDYLLGHLGGCL